MGYRSPGGGYCEPSVKPSRCVPGGLLCVQDGLSRSASGEETILPTTPRTKGLCRSWAALVVAVAVMAVALLIFWMLMWSLLTSAGV